MVEPEIEAEVLFFFQLLEIAKSLITKLLQNPHKRLNVRLPKQEKHFFFKPSI